VDCLVERLETRGRGDPFDRHVFACALAIGLADARVPLTEALGLSPAALANLMIAYFPGSWRELPAPSPGNGSGRDALEEPDLRAFLLEHRSQGVVEEEWLAAIIARRSLGANHLWQDLGLLGRDELNRLMERHFPSLRRLNGGDMKWKKFFYRQLCERDGVAICKAPNCEVCTDFRACFGPEAGEPLSALQAAMSGVRQSGRSDCRRSPTIGSNIP
jgi:nitrogen fixation protein NifQ